MSARVDGDDVGRLAAFGTSRRVTDAGFVDEIDGAVGQPVVAQMAGGELRRGLERGVGVGDAVVLLVAAAQAGQNPHGLFDRRLVDRDLLQPAGERAIFLDLLELLERGRPMTRRSPAVRIGLSSVARSIVPPETAPAPTVEWISSMNRIAFGRVR